MCNREIKPSKEPLANALILIASHDTSTAHKSLDLAAARFQGAKAAGVTPSSASSPKLLGAHLGRTCSWLKTLWAQS